MTAPGEGPGIAALRELVMPVAVVVAAGPGEASCATTTVTYASVQPPVVCVTLTPASRTGQLVQRTRQFSVSLLAAGQAGVAQRAGRRAGGPDKLAAVGIAAEQPPPGIAGPPGISGAAAVLWCEVTQVVPVGDHDAIFGSVRAVRGAGDDAPLLLRHHRHYLATGEAVTPPEPDGYPL